jgi:nucleotide-binding universal stress UspA family protein
MGETEPSFTRIVVGIEEGERPRDALSLGAAMARTLGARLLVAAAIEPAPFPIEVSEHAPARSKRLARIFEGLDELLDGIPHELHELDLDAVGGLEEFAARESADLIVIGSTHRGVLSRVVPGTVADRLLEGAPCPLLVAPHGYAGREHVGLGTIGVGYDGSEEATEALKVAEGLAADLDCELRLIAAVSAYEDVPDPHRATREGRHRATLAEGRRAVDSVPVTDTVGFGDAAHVLASQGLDLDVLVVGSRGHGRLLRTVLGSVASELVRIAPCPVLVVPHHADGGKLSQASERRETQAGERPETRA